MFSYCAPSPTSSPPWARRRATTSSMSSTRNVIRRRPCVFAGRVRLGGGGRRVPERRQLKPAVAVRGLHEGDVHPDVVESDDPVHPTSLDRCHLTHPFHTEFDEERDGSFEVVDDDADMVHPLDRHDDRSPLLLAQPDVAARVLGRSRRHVCDTGAMPRSTNCSALTLPRDLCGGSAPTEPSVGLAERPQRTWSKAIPLLTRQNRMDRIARICRGSRRVAARHADPRTTCATTGRGRTSTATHLHS